MKVLEPIFQKWGVTFTQLKREDDLAIFQAQRSKSGGRWWEVAIIHRHNGYNLGGKNIPPAETYPGNEMMGKIGWACVSLARAEEKFDEVKKLQDKKIANPIVRIEGTRGRQPILKSCICCAKEIYSSVFLRGKGKCPECLEKFLNEKLKKGMGKV